jgi:Zn-dependent peptidase ImmA (M78 family)
MILNRDRAALSPSDQPNKSLAIRRANELTKNFTEPQIPVIEIAESHKVDVMFSDMGNLADRLSGVADFRDRRIYVNVKDRPTRQAFTIAHELGHLLLHRDAFLQNPDLYPLLPRFDEPAGRNAFEVEANTFAANLLVPSHLLKPVRGAAGASALADVFGVSRTMMEHRLKDA